MARACAEFQGMMFGTTAEPEVTRIPHNDALIAELAKSFKG
jgi:hypothetical protein